MSQYKFECEVQKTELDLYYEDDAIAVDMQPTDANRAWGNVDKLNRPSFEAILPVDEAENLIHHLQEMVTEIRNRQPKAA